MNGGDWTVLCGRFCMKDMKNTEAIECSRTCPGESMKVFCKTERITGKSVRGTVSEWSEERNRSMEQVKTPSPFSTKRSLALNQPVRAVGSTERINPTPPLLNTFHFYREVGVLKWGVRASTLAFPHTLHFSLNFFPFLLHQPCLILVCCWSVTFRIKATAPLPVTLSRHPSMSLPVVALFPVFLNYFN